MPKWEGQDEAWAMKVSTILLCDQVVRLGGIHLASNTTGIPVSTVSDAVSRLESALSVKLFVQGAKGLILTAEGGRVGPYLAQAAHEIFAIHGACGDDHTKDIYQRSVSLIALFRFVDILESGSIRKSALRLQIGQPQLTRMMAMLEDNLGVRLFERTRSGSHASPEGLRISPHVHKLRDIWAALDSTSALRFKRHLRHWSFGGIPPATTDSPSAIILARIAANWARRFDTPLLMQPGLADSLLEGLEQQRYDAVLVDMPVNNSRLRSREVLRSHLSCFLQHEAPELTDADSPSQMREAILKHRLVLPSRASGLRQTAESFLEHLLGPTWLSKVQLIEIDSIPVAVQLIVGHGYCSILPSSVGITSPKVTRIPLPMTFSVPLLLAWRADDRGTDMAQRVLQLLDMTN
ncbi:LysR family transcriptional regulator [Agrobacterium tumefaciens]|uniref:LysR family transcriptional regulator n=1 Tax=Agrobacterium tumefaciens TaxID=358 RepID=UPI00157377A5|nr:LysR family transcriptional regulator [Agrobacterium tumefaciens]NSX88302.1 LysR family transcriptional regulator [Agrobacterium tumefaciens]